MNQNDYRAMAHSIGKLFARYGCEANVPQWFLIHCIADHLAKHDKEFAIDEFDNWIKTAERNEAKYLDNQAMQALTNSIVLGNG